jgi:hypothetical protein
MSQVSITFEYNYAPSPGEWSSYFEQCQAWSPILDQIVAQGGLTPIPPFTITTSGVANNTQIGTLPANGMMLYAVIRETAGFAVSVSLGTTAGGTDITASTISVPAGGAIMVPVGAFAKLWISASASTPIYISSLSWSGSLVNVLIAYGSAP